MEFTIKKDYSNQSVYYKWQADENGIWGFWEIGWLKGGFHIWPKTNLNNQEAEALEVQAETNVREEYLEEYLIIPKKQ